MNLFRKLFIDPTPITWRDPAQEQAGTATQPQILPTEQDRLQAHQLIDRTLAHNPQIAQRAHLMTDIAAELMPWIDQNELDHVMTGLRYVPMEKLVTMNDKLSAKETTYKEKAMIKKTVLSQGYLHFANQKLKKQLLIQPLMILTILGSFGYFCYGVAKHNDRAVQTSAITALASYFISDRSKKKFDKETKEARDFWKNMTRHPDEMQRLENERKRWFTPSQQNSK